ncbi:helix-turn-helix domain-containing protein [Streptomyces sp. NBC_01431]|uniref:helix-turn-helix domain-containing protein n=1 Tax=Streptomyces sp. NBC_01431 TaxID=2903863 RepID=UPI002E35D13C|nr:helix-turn-helix domain-containing protein [Streptomyces sp. NBC_01431]
MAASTPEPRRDTRGIIDAADLFAHVRFRRHEPAPALRPYLEHYWLIDWDLPQPYASHVVPHPSVNLVFQRYDDGRPDFLELSGVGLAVDTRKLSGRGRVCGIQFRPGGFRPFAPAFPVSEWTGRVIPAGPVFPAADPTAVLSPDRDEERVAALDAFLLGLDPQPDPQARLAMELVDRIRNDRTVRRVDALAREAGLSARSLQRLFAACVGVGPKWVVLRYRIHEALEHAESDAPIDWARLADELGYADQAHLVRDFTATLGAPPSALRPGGSRP